MEYHGRLRKYYNLTRVGREKIFAFTAEWGQLAKAYEYILWNLKG
jgi:DNA-binding PadR family transcriptional regulator